MPAFGDDITGTEALVAALEPSVMRIGGYNNDANTPQPFDNRQFDKAVAYARAIGAEPPLQVHLHEPLPGSPLFTLRGRLNSGIGQDVGDGGAANFDLQAGSERVADLRVAPAQAPGVCPWGRKSGTI
jgi:hypothetical protein